MIKPGGKIFVILTLIVAIQNYAFSCPMCKPGGDGGSIAAYQGTTIFLALLPFALLAGMFYWLKTKMNKNETNPN